jgi:hypothetical protein
MVQLLTKSKYMAGLESDALLWLRIHDFASIPEPDPVLQARFDAGHEFEILVRSLFDGVDLSDTYNSPNIELTKKEVENRKIIFEAGFSINNLYSRSDILSPNDDGSWDLFEIKSSTKVKVSHVKDLAFQKHVLELSGLKIKNCAVILLNREYVRGDALDSEALVKYVDLTEEVNKDIIDIELRIKHMFEVIELPECPPFDFHDIPKSEYGNHLIDEFLGKEPLNSIFNLYKIREKKAIELVDSGINTLEIIPTNFRLSEQQTIQIETTKNKTINIQKDAIKSFLNKITYPVYYLDFETISEAIPKFKNSRSYDQIPFQYSLHIEHETGNLEHKEFLYVGNEDPRPSFLESLKKDLQGAKTILVYYESFEITRLRELAEYFPEHSTWIDEAINKIVDLIVPFKNFSYHNPKQQGSCSIKQVMPLFCNKTYQTLNIKNGEEASYVYQKNFGNLTPEQKKDLLAYCELDTEGMIYILQGLKKLVETL